MNHWVSATGPRDLCTACGEKIDNASESGVVLVTGDCKAPPKVRLGRHGFARIVCRGCADKPPYGGVCDLDVGLEQRPGWCASCRKFVGDDAVVVPESSPAAAIVEALLDASRALLGGS